MTEEYKHGNNADQNLDSNKGLFFRQINSLKEELTKSGNFESYPYLETYIDLISDPRITEADFLAIIRALPIYKDKYGRSQSNESQLTDILIRKLVDVFKQRPKSLKSLFERSINTMLGKGQTYIENVVKSGKKMTRAIDNLDVKNAPQELYRRKVDKAIHYYNQKYATPNRQPFVPSVKYAQESNNVRPSELAYVCFRDVQSIGDMLQAVEIFYKYNQMLYITDAQGQLKRLDKLNAQGYLMMLFNSHRQGKLSENFFPFCIYDKVRQTVQRSTYLDKAFETIKQKIGPGKLPQEKPLQEIPKSKPAEIQRAPEKEATAVVTTTGLSEKGPRNTNQDTIYHGPIQNGKYQLGIVADGMGGHQGGEYFSSQLVAKLKDALEKQPNISEAFLRQIIFDTHFELKDRTAGTDYGSGGTTVVLAVVDSKTGQTFWANVGDSRLYHQVQGVRQVSFDDKGVPGSEAFKNVLSQAVGQMITEVHTGSFVLGLNQQLILTSDGVHEPFQEAGRALQVDKNLNSADAIVKQALDFQETLQIPKKTRDNASAVVVQRA